MSPRFLREVPSTPQKERNITLELQEEKHPTGPRCDRIGLHPHVTWPGTRLLTTQTLPSATLNVRISWEASNTKC